MLRELWYTPVRMCLMALAAGGDATAGNAGVTIFRVAEGASGRRLGYTVRAFGTYERAVFRLGLGARSIGGSTDDGGAPRGDVAGRGNGGGEGRGGEDWGGRESQNGEGLNGGELHVYVVVCVVVKKKTKVLKERKER